KLKSRAKGENRSLSAEVTRILAEAVTEPRKLSILRLEGLGRKLWHGIDAANYVEEERTTWL
ncbi:MAG TPA: hypothetical protein VHM24_10620, partial [Gemmatimonadaceae bacterium]|nr:hypothetical protein [Gemmatimonadaceae bacterium]